MVEVTEADKAALQAYLTERHRRTFAGRIEPHADLLLETLARHRIAAENAALERAAKAWEDGQMAFDAATSPLTNHFPCRDQGAAAAPVSTGICPSHRSPPVGAMTEWC